MSISLPSKPIFIADVPEVPAFRQPKFVYNYFTPDETSNETGTPPASFEKRPVSYFESVTDTSAISRRLPRYVQLHFQPAIHDTDPGYVARTPNDDGYIAGNLSKIVSEDSFAVHGYLGLHFEPVNFRDKLFSLVSGSSTAFSVPPKVAASLPVSSGKLAAMSVNAGTPDDIPPSFLTNAMTKPAPDDDAENRVMALRVMFDTRVVASAIATSLYDPLSTYNEDIRSLWEFLRPIESKARSVSDYKVLKNKEFDPEIEYISIEYGDDSVTTNESSSRIVGYIIDKWEMLPNGEARSIQPPIVLEDPKATSFLDSHIKYGTKYAYAIRTIAEAKIVIPVDQPDGSTEMALATVLISSRPTVKRFVDTSEHVPPPVPVDVDFVWDYDARQMTVFWAFPTNSQRDIKKFQIYRRSTVDQPFELLHVIDFNDSEFVYPDPENDGLPLEVVTRRPPGSPVTFYVDEEFTRDTSFVYAIASVDAHGMTSGYSQQFRVSFDRFKNQLIKALVSPSGAPKVYPNFYIMQDAFVDVMTGSQDTSLHVYFSPDGYRLVDHMGGTKDMVQTTETGGYYHLTVLNTDLQKQRSVNITVRRLESSVPTSLGGFMDKLAR